MSRQYFNCNIEQFLQLIATGSKDLALLSALEVALQHRSAPPAKALAQEVSRAQKQLSLGGFRKRRHRQPMVQNGEQCSRRVVLRTKDGVSNIERDSAEFSKSVSHIIGVTSRAAEMNSDSFSHHPMTQPEIGRLTDIYEKLRQRLLDMSLRNPMLNFRVSATSKRQLLFVDEIPEQIYIKLVGQETALDIVPLPEPDDIPNGHLSLKQH